jgi:hypothetical protein
VFHLSLELPSSSVASSVPAGLDADDFPSLVMEACELLRETDCRFRMGGFGLEDWNLDVGYDMSSVIEQLPELLSALQSGTDAELDLYTPGVERSISFVADGSFINAKCQSLTSWVPPDPVERLDSREIIEMFEKLAIDFARAVAIVNSDMASIRPLDRWQKAEV